MKFRRKTIFLGALIFLVFCAFFVKKTLLNRQVVLPIEKRVTISTDKKSYRQGEAVKIAVKNDTQKPIWYARNVYCGASFWQLLDWQKKEIPYYSLCLWDDLQHRFTKLNPGGILKEEWNGKVWDSKTYQFKPAPIGLYNIVFPYSLREKRSLGEGWDTDRIEVYSSQILIK